MVFVLVRQLPPDRGSLHGGAPRGAGNWPSNGVMALARVLHFRDKRSVRRVISRGRRLRTPLGEILVMPHAEDAGRILFVVSARAAKKSVDRHRIKRRLDGWINRNHVRIPKWDIVVLVSPDAARSGRSLMMRADSAFHTIESLR